MKNKGLIAAALAVVAIIVFMVLPLATLTYGEETVMSLKGFHYITGSVEISFMGFTQSIPVELEIDVILLIIGAALTVFAGVKNSKKLALTGTIIGFLVMLINVGNAAEKFGGLNKQGMEASVGIGMWIALICYAGAVVMSFMMTKPVVEEPAAFVTGENNQQ